MGVIARKADPSEDLRYLDGPWRNDACTGYLIEAMKRLGYNQTEIYDVVMAQRLCFDETTVEEAAKVWYEF